MCAEQIHQNKGNFDAVQDYQQSSSFIKLALLTLISSWFWLQNYAIDVTYSEENECTEAAIKEAMRKAGGANYGCG